MTPPELDNVRKKYPQYSDMSDTDLADALAKKYPQYQDLPGKVRAAPAQPKEQGILGTAADYAKRFISSSYLDPSGQPRKETDFLGAITRPVTETYEGLTDIAKQAGRQLLPPFMRPEEKTKPSVGEGMRDIGSVIMALNPELIPILSVANVLGEATYGVTRSPLAGGIVENLAAIFSPGGVKKIGDKLAGKVATSDAAKAAKAAEQSGRVAAQQAEVGRATEGVRAAEGAIKEAEAGVGKAQGEEAAASSYRSIAEGTEQFAEEQVKGRAKEAERIRKAGLAAPKTTTLEFGEKFAGPDYAPKPTGYYPEAKAAAKQKASELYGEAQAEAEKVAVPTAKLAESLARDLEAQGIAAEIVPTRAEVFAKKAIGVLDPLEEDAKGYQEIAQQLSQQQLSQLEKGGGLSGSVPSETGRALSNLFMGATHPEIAQRIQRVVEAGKVPILTDVPATDLVTLRQRVNGAIRAAADSKRFDIANQLKKYKGYIEQSLPENVLTKLRIADQNYASNYIPYFGPKAELSKIVESKNPAAIFKNIVPKDDPAQVRQAMEILSPDAQQAMKGAFYHSLYDEATSRMGVNWPKLVREYDSYTPEVKEALLGGEKATWDKMMGSLHEFQQNARVNLKASEDFLKAAKADTKIQIKVAGDALRAQEKALGKRETARLGFDKKVSELGKQNKEMDALLKAIEEENKPRFYKGSYLESRKRMLLVFAAIDIGKWTLGIGSPNILKYGIGDLASLYIISNPRVMTAVTRKGGQATRILSDYLSTRYADPSKLAGAAAVTKLAEMVANEDREKK